MSEFPTYHSTWRNSRENARKKSFADSLKPLMGPIDLKGCVQPLKNKTPLTQGFATQKPDLPKPNPTQFFESCGFNSLRSPSETARTAVCSA
jgi:hypothetical protein